MIAESRVSFTRYQLLVAGLVVLAAVLRLWNIGSVPLELHPDEMGPFTGVRDMLIGHRPFAVFIESDVVYLPLYGLFEFVSAAIFGDTVTAMRVPAALLGVATALGTGALAYSFVRDRAAFALGVGIMAILPWDVSLSRIGWEPAATLPFLLFGIYLLRRGLRQTSGRSVIFGCALLAIGAYSYRAEAFDAAALALALLAFEFRRTWRMRRALGIGAAVAAFIVAPLAVAFLVHPAYFSSGPAQATFMHGINDGTLYNFRTRYLAQFALPALFATGDGNWQHGLDMGVLYWWMLPFILIGICAPARILDLPGRLFLYVWILVYPVGNALINEIPPQHFVRTLIGAPLFAILTTIGCIVACRLLRERVSSEGWRAAALTVFAGVVFLQFVPFCYAYFTRYPEVSADAFQYGDREIFAFVRAHASTYDRVCFTAVGGWNWTTLTRYYARDLSIDMHSRIDPVCTRPHTLFGVEKREDAPAHATLLGTVQRRDGTTRAWFLGT